MTGILLYVTPIISAIFFVNFIFILKNIQKNKPITNNIVWGAILSALLTFAFLFTTTVQ